MSWTARSTPVSSPFMTTSTCRPSTRAASWSTRARRWNRPRIGHDPERLKGVPDLEREPDQGISAVGHRGGRGVSRCGQDGQVVGLFLQAAELIGEVCLGIDQRGGASGPLAPGRRRAVGPGSPAGGCGSPAPSPRTSSWIRLARARNAPARSARKPGPSARRTAPPARGSDLPRVGCARSRWVRDRRRRACRSIRGSAAGRIALVRKWAAQSPRGMRRAVGEASRSSRRGSRRPGASRSFNSGETPPLGLPEPFLQLVNERGQFLQTHAARGSLEGVKAPTQLMDRVARGRPGC